ncbi:MAG TPA: hypothetical protein VGY54_03855 [Polyangiaceae bacterium]|jgi:hypothetical protein|nr:hypothetical protein [Polyangiaceae bacterium]
MDVLQLTSGVLAVLRHFAFLELRKQVPNHGVAAAFAPVVVRRESLDVTKDTVEPRLFWRMGGTVCEDAQWQSPV